MRSSAILLKIGSSEVVKSHQLKIPPKWGIFSWLVTGGNLLSESRAKQIKVVKRGRTSACTMHGAAKSLSGVAGVSPLILRDPCRPNPPILNIVKSISSVVYHAGWQSVYCAARQI